MKTTAWRMITILLIAFPLRSQALTGTYSGGTGTSGDPAQISSVADLLKLAATTDDYAEHFILTTDLDLSGQSFNSAVIAADPDTEQWFQGAVFAGSFDGNGKTISNLTIEASSSPTNDYLGLFGYIEGTNATVFDLTLANVSINTGGTAMYVGGLCGSNNGEISGCTVSGTITTGTDSEINGGLCGHNLNLITNCQSSCSLTVGDSDSASAGGLCGQNEGFITDSSASGTVSGETVNTVGGLCGFNDGGTITNCAASGDVTGGTAASTFGGLVGSNTGGTLAVCRASGAVTAHESIGGLCGYNSGQVTQCYATGSITMAGDEGYGAGGLIGENGGSANECYSIGALTLPPLPWEPGGLIGADDGGSVSASFWNTETSGLTNSAGGTGLPTSLMQAQSTFTAAGWDFSNVWKMDGFPVHLSAEPPVVQIVSIQVGGSISVEEETSEQYSCLALYTDGSSNDVTQTADWSVSPTNYASISTNGLLTALNVTTDRTVNVQAVYTDADGSYTNTLEMTISPAAGPYSGGAGTIEDPYLIATKADLLALRTTTADYDKHFALIANIDLSGEIFTNAVIAPSFAHGNYNGTPFSGTFDGQGYVVSNLMINVEGLLADDYLGLFGRTQYYEPTPEESEGNALAAPLASSKTTVAVIKDLGVENVLFVCGEVATYVGGLVGENTAGLISGCHASGTITGGEFSEQWGGLCGSNQGTLSNCHATASLLFGDNESNRNGGLVGLNSGTVLDCYATAIVSGGPDQCGHIGGLVGFSSEGSQIINSHSEGSVLGSSNVGGLCGRTSDDATISNCYSTCTVSGSESIGGLIGYFDTGVMTYCYASGDVTGTTNAQNAGGLIGYGWSAQIINCYSTGNLTCSNGVTAAGGLCGILRNNTIISNCYSAGTLNLIGTQNQVGGFCGTNSSSIISSSFWDTQTSGLTNSAGGAGKTTAEMQAESTFTAEGWDFNNTWYMHGYPELQALDTVEKTDYLTWAANEGIPLLERGPTDSPANDGIPNILKYVAGLPAMTPATPADIMSIAAASEDGMFSITYTKSKTAEGAELLPVWTDGLDSDWIPEGITHELIETNGDVETWKVSIPLQTQGFMRLNVLLPGE